MHRPSTDLPGLVRAARRSRGWSQQLVADRIGVTQPSVSKFERGVEDLAPTRIALLGELLGIDTSGKGTDTVAPRPVEIGTILWFCSDPDCSSHQPWPMLDRCQLVPRLVRCAPTASPRCPACGEVLEHLCPACKHLVQEGASCVRCGHDYVPALEGPGEPAQRAETRLRALAQLRQHTSVRDLAFDETRQ